PDRRRNPLPSRPWDDLDGHLRPRHLQTARLGHRADRARLRPPRHGRAADSRQQGGPATLIRTTRPGAPPIPTGGASWFAWPTSAEPRLRRGPSHPLLPRVLVKRARVCWSSSTAAVIPITEAGRGTGSLHGGFGADVGALGGLGFLVGFAGATGVFEPGDLGDGHVPPCLAVRRGHRRV